MTTTGGSPMPEEAAKELKDASKELAESFDGLARAVSRSRWVNIVLVSTVVILGWQSYTERADVKCVTRWANVTNTRANAVGSTNAALLGSIVGFIQTPPTASRQDRREGYNRLTAAANKYALEQRTHPVPPLDSLHC